MSNDLISRKAVLELMYETHMDKLSINDKKITELIKELTTAYDIDKVVSYIDRVANSGLGKSKSLEHIKKYVKGGAE